MKLEKLTASSIRDWKSNPRMFYYRHMLRLQLPQKQMNLLFGGAIHKAIEYGYNEKFKSKADVFEAFEENFDSSKLTSDELADYAPHLVEGRRLLESFIECQDYLQSVWDINPNGLSEVRFRDTQWTNPLTNEPLGIPVTGIVDRRTVDGDIIEFKTASKPYKQEDIDSYVQPTVYSHWYLSQFRKMPRRTVYVVLTKFKEQPIQVLQTERGFADFIELQETMQVIKSSVERDYFPDRRSTFFDETWKYEELVKL